MEVQFMASKEAHPSPVQTLAGRFVFIFHICILFLMIFMYFYILYIHIQISLQFSQDSKHLRNMALDHQP